MASRALRELEVVGGLVEAAIAAVARRYDLSHAALNALAVIEGHGQPVTSGDVGARMHITSGTVTTLLDNLERKGFVTRSVDKADRRRVLVDITPAAQAVLDKMLPEVQLVCRYVMDDLGPKGQQDLVNTLARVREGLTKIPDELPTPKPRRRPRRLSRPQ